VAGIIGIPGRLQSVLAKTKPSKRVNSSRADADDSTLIEKVTEAELLPTNRICGSGKGR
jgi:hypothetical protein